MIDAQSEIAPLATVAPEEFYGAYTGTEDDGPDHEDIHPQHDCDGPADDSHMYPQDVEQDEYPW
jgi:hypothetical protein